MTTSAETNESSKPESWLIRIPNQNVRASFSNFVSNLVDFSNQFRKEKYAHYFFVMADPMDQLFEFIVSPKPPEDVLVATLSGSLKTSLNLLTARKNGKHKNAEFMQLSGRVNDGLGTFITSLQDAIRRNAELKEDSDIERKKSTGAKKNVNRRKTHVDSDPMLLKKIDRLRDPPSKPTVLSKFRSGLFNSPLIMIAGIVLCGCACGAFGCTEWYSIERVVWAWVGPFVVLGIGLALLGRGYYVSHIKNPTYDEVTWRNKFPNSRSSSIKEAKAIEIKGEIRI